MRWTHDDMLALFKWQQRRNELVAQVKAHGTNETKAAELGISVTNLSTLLNRARNRFVDMPPQPSGIYDDIRRENIRRTKEAEERRS